MVNTMINSSAYGLLIFCFLLYLPHVWVNKVASKHTESTKILFQFSLYVAAISMVTGLLLVLVERERFSFDFVTVGTALLFGIISAICSISTFYAFRVTSVAVVNMSATSSVIIPCIVGMLFFHESVSVGKILGVALFLIAAYCITTSKNKDDKRFTWKSLLACIVVFLTSGVGSIAIQLFSRYSEGVSDSLFMFYSYVFNSLILLIFVFVLSKKESGKQHLENSSKDIRFSKKLVLLGIIISVITFALQQINVVLANEIPSAILFPVLKSGSLIFGAGVGWAIFKEKLSVKNMIGLVLCIGALVVLNL